MNLKQNKNYFTKGEGLKIVGIVLIVLGVMLYFFGMGYWSYVLMLTVIPTGIILFFVGASGRLSDTEMDAFIACQLEDFDPHPEETKEYAKRVQKHLSPDLIEGYAYEDGVLLKRAKDGKIRSSHYTRTAIYQLTDAFYLASRHVSLIAEDVRNEYLEIPYRTVTAVELLRESATMPCGKKQFSVKRTELVITCGEQSFHAPIQDDTNADRLVERLRKVVAEAEKLQ